MLDMIRVVLMRVMVTQVDHLHVLSMELGQLSALLPTVSNADYPMYQVFILESVSMVIGFAK